jgi:hypothetical protein
MSKGKFLSKLSFFKKKKRISNETLRSNSTSSTPSNHNMESIPEIVRGNTVPISSTGSLESNLYSNKRKNISNSSVEIIDKKKKQPSIEASSSKCPIPTPAESATTSSACHDIASITETNSTKSCNEKDNEISSPSGSNSLNNNLKDKKMKEPEDKVSYIPKVRMASELEEKNESSSSESQNKNNIIDTPPHTPTATIFVTSKSTVSSIDTYDDNGTRNNQPSSSQNNNDNETKSNEDDFNIYVEDIINKLALDTNLTPEAQTEEPNREITEHYNPAEQLTTESLTPIPSSNNISIIQQQHQQTPSNLRIVQNISSSDTDTPVNNNTINVSNTNFRKETCNNDTSNLKKNNENKKEKKVDDDNNSRDKENKTNDKKAKNSDIEKYLENENTHTITESMDVLNNTIEMLKCGICLDILLDPKIVEPCGHSFCNHCLRMLQTRVCPLCRTRIHDYHSSVLLNELSELIAKYSLDKDQLEERNQCCHEIEEKDKHLNDECMRLMELMELAHQSDNTNNYSVQFHEMVELNETDDDI